MWFLRKPTIALKPATTLIVTGSYLTFKDLTIHQALVAISPAAHVTPVVFDGIYTRERIATDTSTFPGFSGGTA